MDFLGLDDLCPDLPKTSESGYCETFESIARANAGGRFSQAHEDLRRLGARDRYAGTHGRRMPPAWRDVQRRRGQFYPESPNQLHLPGPPGLCFIRRMNNVC